MPITSNSRPIWPPSWGRCCIMVPSPNSSNPICVPLHTSEVGKYNKRTNYISSIPGNSESVQFSHSVMSDSLRPHGLQHTRLPCPLPTPWACSYSCPLSQWCHPTISSSVIPLFSCLQSFPASGSFLKSQFIISGGQKYWSFSFSPFNEYSGLISFRMDWLDLLAVQGTLKSLLQHHSSKASILQCSAFFIVQLSHL